MSQVITGVLQVTFGLISEKVRSYGAEKLQNGGLTAQKLRSWIVGELDGINSKLDNSSRKDLFTSTSCLQQGVDRLSMCFGDSLEAGNKIQDVANIGAITSTPTKPDKASVAVDGAIATANAIGKLNLVSSERFELAKESFKEAGKKAREAFQNAALTTEERILASKVRIASGILEHLNDPEFAATDCLQYCRELHNLSAIQDIFSVHIKAGFKSWVTSGFRQDSGAEIVETVTMINLILADFISKFTKRRMAVFDWPMIKCGKQVVHPIYYKKDCSPNLNKMAIKPPWVMAEGFETRLHEPAFNNTADLLCFCDDVLGLHKLDTKTGELQLYCTFPSQDEYSRYVRCLAVDEDDTVYVLSGDSNVGYKLSIFSSDGRNTCRCTLEFLKVAKRFDCTKMTVTGGKNIVIAYKSTERGSKEIMVWICDTNGELKNNFGAAKGPAEDLRHLEKVFATRNNEVILATSKSGAFKTLSYVLYIYTKDGRLQRTVPCRPSDGECYSSICYSKVIKNIVGCIHFNDRIIVEFLCDQTGDLLCSYALYKENLPENSRSPVLVCHSNGTLALVDNNHVRFLQTPFNMNCNEKLCY